MVANPAESALEGDETEAVILCKGKRPQRVPRVSKRELAALVIERMASVMGKAHD